MLATGSAAGSRYPDRTVTRVDSTVCVLAIPMISVLVRQFLPDCGLVNGQRVSDAEGGED
jgi:hypothetical protein